MWRNILGVIAGLVAWGVVIVVGGFVLRAWPAYEAAAPSMSFDVSMMIARLSLSSLSLIVAAWVAQRVARPSRYAAIALGVLLLVFFIPVHIQLWPKFPPWYHLTFLISLVALPQLTAMISARGAQPATT